MIMTVFFFLLALASTFIAAERFGFFVGLIWGVVMMSFVSQLPF